MPRGLHLRAGGAMPESAATAVAAWLRESAPRDESRKYPLQHRPGTQSSMSTPTGQWSEPVSCGQMNASRTRRIAPGEAIT